MATASWAYSSGRPRRFGNGTPAARPARNSSETPASIGVSMMPGAIVITRMPEDASSRAAGRVRPTTPPLDEEYAACPIWPSNAATEAVLITTPRWLSSSAGVLAMASAASRSTLNVPIRLTSMTFRYVSRSCGPFLPTIRPAVPTPAQLTVMRSGAPAATTVSTAACTCSGLVTSAST